MAGRELVAVERVGHGYGAQTVLHDVSLSVASGEVVGLLGSNGAGKSTLLRIIVGLIAPRTGRVRSSAAGAPGRIVGLFEGEPSDPRRTPLQTCEVVHAMLRSAGTADLVEPRAALGECGLSSVEWGKRTGQLSQGMRQRARLACVMMTAPELLVLDEPQWGLDPSTVEAMWRVIRSRVKAGSAVLVSSHLIDDLERHCSRVVGISNGTISTDLAVHEDSPGSRLRVSPSEVAIGVLEAQGCRVEQRGDGSIDVAVASGQVHELIARLVQEGVAVHECAPIRSSLRERLMARDDAVVTARQHGSREFIR